VAEDCDAIEGAKQLAAGRVIELWCAERFVAKFEPKPEPKLDNGETTNIR
jgi:hypothetical protein